MGFRFLAKATIASDVPVGSGNTQSTMNTSVMKRGGRSTLASVLAGAGALLLRSRFTVKAAQEPREDVVTTSDVELRVIRFQALIERTRTGAVVELLRIKLGFPREVFERAVTPVIEGYAEFAQLLPESESPCVNPDDLFTRSLDIATRALDYRRGQILPRGAAPEVIGAQAHRWTYAVFVSALLCGVRTSSSDQAGHATQLLDRFVPPSVLGWLAEDPALMREFLAFLSDADWAQAGAISELVLRAATESGSRYLLPHSRRDPIVQEAAAPDAPCDVNAGTATMATNESTLPDEEPEYLEDVDDGHGPPRQTVPATDPSLTQSPDTAHRFMAWLQQGLADGTLRVNQAGSLVHFVDEGMLLVSPRIFREFAKHFDEDGGSTANAPGEPDIGKSIQRQVLRAGWHLRADKGVNILTYQVMRGNRPASRLSGVVISDPARFVHPVPPVNPLLVRLREERGDA
ncbi:MAG: helicase/relaxase domain-containing protein [Bradyrhizobium sp.]|uniref:helicase/relaxase domain-containing protein n=1 Tax=Bradyrhizobium sp. TaxID=376 RepID=UPI003D0DD8FC